MADFPKISETTESNECDITDSKRILKSILRTASCGSQFIPVSRKLSEDTDRLTRYITSGHKPKSEQIPDPLGILGIVLVPFDSLHPLGIGDGNIYFVFQKVEHRYPILTGRFHADITTGITEQPFLKLKNGIVEGGEALLLIRRLDSGSGFDDCGDEKRFVNIDTTAGLINNFHKQCSFLK